jgi:hypothetical protein
VLCVFSRGGEEGVARGTHAGVFGGEGFFLGAEDACHEELCSSVMWTYKGYRNAYSFFERAVLEDPPHTCVDAKILPEMEEREQCVPCGFQRTADIARYAAVSVLICLDDHDAMPIITSEEKILP